MIQYILYNLIRESKMIYTTDYESPLGTLFLSCDDEGLLGVSFMKESLEINTYNRETYYLEQAKEWLDIYFSGHDPCFFPKLHLTGSSFRNRVGEIMCDIPFGKTVTYSSIANQIASERGLEKMSAQAVGGAVGHNPIAIIVPCHRVVGTNGNLTGYGGGIMKKKALLELEGNDMSLFTLPTKGNAL